MKAVNVALVDYIDLLQSVRNTQCERLGIPLTPLGKGVKFPNGEGDLSEMLREHIVCHRYGNQKFTNDTVFIYCFGDEGPETAIEQLLHDLCKPYIYTDGLEYIYFNVCW